MRLSEGEYRDSLQLLFPVAETYWGDVIYIAERVLTVDELKAFVDGLPPPSAPQARSRSVRSGREPARLAGAAAGPGRADKRGGRLLPAAAGGFDSGRT